MGNIYDENDMVDFIQKHAESSELKSLDYDNLIYLSDLVDEFLETRGFLTDDAEEDDRLLDEYDKLVTGEDKDLYEYVVKNIKRDDFDEFPLSLNSFIEFMELQDEYYDTLDEEE